MALEGSKECVIAFPDITFTLADRSPYPHLQTHPTIHPRLSPLYAFPYRNSQTPPVARPQIPALPLDPR